MLIVNSEGTTNVVVTLYEKASNKVNPYFLWNLTRKGSNDVITFTADDISPSWWYWNSFNITVATSSISLTQGVIPLIEGEWEYKIYEMEQPYTIGLTYAIGECERGIMVVGLTFSEPVSVVENQPIPVSTLR